MRLPRKQKVVSSNLTGGSFLRTAGVENVLPQEGPRRVVRLETWRQGAYNGTSHVPVAQLDKAPDYESGDWGFKSLLGYFLLLRLNREQKSGVAFFCCLLLLLFFCFFFFLLASKRDKWACDTTKNCTLDGIRTRNPQIRSLMRYPLRHECS